MENLDYIKLAFLGDSAYELKVREHILGRSNRPDILHREAVKYVKAGAQAKIIKLMLNEDFFIEEEKEFIRKARNHKSPSRSRTVDPMEYKMATAFEAIIGKYHYEGNISREEEIINRALEIIDNEEEK